MELMNSGKMVLKLLLFLLIYGFFTSCTEKKENVTGPVTSIDTIAYCLGMDMGIYLKNTQILMDGDTLNFDLIFRGLKDAMVGDPLFNDDYKFELLRHYFSEILPEKALLSSENFLDSVVNENPDIVISKDGLLYRIDESGNDTRPVSDSDFVTLMYEIKRKDGSVVESTYEYGGIPVDVSLESLLPGWREGLKLIGEGGAITLWLCPDLAFGREGNEKVGVNQALIIRTELIYVNSPVKK